MTLITSISGVRGTVGGRKAENLTPWEILNLGSAFADMLWERAGTQKPLVLIGRDGRLSGEAYLQILAGVMASKGVDVALLDLTTTPTLAFATPKFKAQGGIMLSASHNHGEWNALKFYNSQGEFLAENEIKLLLEKAKVGNFSYAPTTQLGQFFNYHEQALDLHLQAICAYPWVKKTAIAERNLRIVVDCINSGGALAIPKLLAHLGVENITLINADIDLDFAHNPEPLDAHLGEIKQKVLENKADLGIVVDPDVDRLCLVTEEGVLFGEEYTLVAIADYLAKFVSSDFVNNVLSTQALQAVAKQYGRNCYSTAVGEIRVIEGMKARGALIGGEGSGGIIIGDFHYGRDALLGIALFLSALAEFGGKASALRAKYPNYHMIKDKLPLAKEIDLCKCRVELQKLYPQGFFEQIDGLKMNLVEAWVCVRKSNTEPILRIYAEAKTEQEAQNLAIKVKQIVENL